MSVKVRDNRNRWRNKIVAFRMSPEESESLNMRVHLSGLNKQTYIITRCLERDVVVQGNPRVYMALKHQLRDLQLALEQMPIGCGCCKELQETIQMVAITLNGLKSGEEEGEKNG